MLMWVKRILFINLVTGLLVFGMSCTTPKIIGLGDLEGGIHSSTAWAVSSNGCRVVGESASDKGREAFLWVKGVGIKGLGDLAGGKFESVALEITADGNMVVGYSFGSKGREGFYWQEPGPLVGIGDLPGGSYTSKAYAVSASGVVIVGEGQTNRGSEAFIWTERTWLISLERFLADAGLDTTASLGQLTGAYAISDNGRYIVGSGIKKDGKREAFLVDLRVVMDR